MSANNPTPAEIAAGTYSNDRGWVETGGASHLRAAADEVGRVASELHAAVNNTSFDTRQQSAVAIQVNRLLALQTQLQTAADGNAPAVDPFKNTRVHAGTDQFQYNPAPHSGREGERRSGKERRTGQTSDPRGRGAPERRSNVERRVASDSPGFTPDSSGIAGSTSVSPLSSADYPNS